MVWTPCFWRSAPQVLGLEARFARFVFASLYLHAALLVVLLGRPAPATPAPLPETMLRAPGAERALGPAWLGTHLLIGSPVGDGPPVVDLLAAAPRAEDLDAVLARIQGVRLPARSPNALANRLDLGTPPPTASRPVPNDMGATSGSAPTRVERQVPGDGRSSRRRRPGG